MRHALLADARGCAYVHHTSWIETYSGLIPASHWATDTLERRTEDWAKRLDEGVIVTVAELAEQIIGIAGTREAQPVGDYEPVRELDLSLLYVLAAHHGSGAGQTLLDTVLPPGTPAQLWVADANPRAHRFYERNGFSPDGARHVGGNVALTAVRLVR